MALQTRISWARPLTDYTKVQRAIASVLRGRRIQFAGAKREKRYLNAGCGPNIRKEFLNLDYTWRPGIDLCWDLTKALPLPDSSLDGVYSEHCLEHLTYDDAQFALRELRRVLRPRGTIRVVVPDAELIIDLYRRSAAGEKVQFPYVDEPPPHGFTPLLAVNRVFRSHGHLFAYDAATMTEALKRAGFSEVRRESFRTGSNPTLLIDSEVRAIESLYMEASR